MSVIPTSVSRSKSGEASCSEATTSVEQAMGQPTLFGDPTPRPAAATTLAGAVQTRRAHRCHSGSRSRTSSPWRCGPVGPGTSRTSCLEQYDEESRALHPPGGSLRGCAFLQRQEQPTKSGTLAAYHRVLEQREGWTVGRVPQVDCRTPSGEMERLAGRAADHVGELRVAACGTFNVEILSTA